MRKKRAPPAQQGLERLAGEPADVFCPQSGAAGVAVKMTAVTVPRARAAPVRRGPAAERGRQSRRVPACPGRPWGGGS